MKCEDNESREEIRRNKMGVTVLQRNHFVFFPFNNVCQFSLRTSVSLSQREREKTGTKKKEKEVTRKSSNIDDSHSNDDHEVMGNGRMNE